MTGGSTDQPPSAAEPAPLLRIVDANATPEEVAAIVAVFASLGGTAATKPRRVPEWSANHHTQRRTYRRGPGGWRASALPR